MQAGHSYLLDAVGKLRCPVSSALAYVQQQQQQHQQQQQQGHHGQQQQQQQDAQQQKHDEQQQQAHHHQQQQQEQSPCAGEASSQHQGGAQTPQQQAHKQQQQQQQCLANEALQPGSDHVPISSAGSSLIATATAATGPAAAAETSCDHLESYLPASHLPPQASSNKKRKKHKKKNKQGPSAVTPLAPGNDGTNVGVSEASQTAALTGAAGGVWEEGVSSDEESEQRMLLRCQSAAAAGGAEVGCQWGRLQEAAAVAQLMGAFPQAQVLEVSTRGLVLALLSYELVLSS